jgi:hypothetical protein
LTTVNGGEGLEDIGDYAFYGCTSLREITIPPAVKAIKEKAFWGCSQLTTVNLSEGLEQIGKRAFGRCISLQRIVIPSTVIAIHKKACYHCTSLTHVEFCNEVHGHRMVDAELVELWSQ